MQNMRTRITKIIVRTIVYYKGKILLVKKQDSNFWHLPGGHLDETESLKECALRETLEETGQKIKKYFGKNLDNLLDIFHNLYINSIDCEIWTKHYQNYQNYPILEPRTLRCFFRT